MANKRVFKTGTPVPVADTTNRAGGRAYSRDATEALALYAATGTFNDTFYATGKEHLDDVLTLAKEVDDEFLARVAVWARNSAYMKDSPALLLALLSTRNTELFKRAFPRVIGNGRMLRTFVQIMRSGVTGRRSLGSAPKRAIQKLVTNWSDERVFDASVGNDPSLVDVLKMVHPRPANLGQEALFAYLIGREFNADVLPEVVKKFEAWKADRRCEMPAVNFQLLTAQELSTNDWVKIFKTAKWHFTRMNLNTAKRHGVFDVEGMTKLIADRLRDPEAIEKAMVFPYQLFAAYLNVDDDVPAKVKNALHDAMELAVKNIPAIDGKVFVGIDRSGSMGSSITGFRAGATSKVTCNDVASLIGASILRQNEDAEIYVFDGTARKVNGLSARDTILTNADKMRGDGGVTDTSAVLKLLNRNKAKGDLVVMVSDMECWACPYSWRDTGTHLAAEWQTFKRRNPKARMVLIDLRADGKTQAKTEKDVLNVAGFSDQVYTAIAEFAKNGRDGSFYVEEIGKTEI